MKPAAQAGENGVLSSIYLSENILLRVRARWKINLEFFMFKAILRRSEASFGVLIGKVSSKTVV